MFVEKSSFWSLKTERRFFVKYHIDVCRFKNMNKILGSVKKKCIFVIYRRAFLKVGKNDVESNILLL